MIQNELQLTILVKNRPITEYPHDDQIFVEGRPGSEYEIEVRNHTYQRIEAVLSVDGLSVIDGKPAGAHSRGYLIGPRGVIRIPGWTLDTAQVAKFAFAGKQDSYATQMTGDARNNGVIGVMGYREKLNYFVNSQIASGFYGADGSMRSQTLNAASSSRRGIEISTRGIAPASPSSNCMYDTMEQGRVGSVQQSLGTAFGEAASFATTTVAFLRGLILGTLVVHYDTLKGLRARGVVIKRNKITPSQPNAFPGMACTPPPGWRG